MNTESVQAAVDALLDKVDPETYYLINEAIVTLVETAYKKGRTDMMDDLVKPPICFDAEGNEI